MDETKTEVDQQDSQVERSHCYDGSIYVLIDPRCCSIRYVGQTFNVKRRKYQHQQDLRWQGNYELFQWKRELKQLNLSPIFKVIETGVGHCDINDRERFWCRRKSDDGERLFNKPTGAIRKQDLFGNSERMEIRESVRDLRDSLFQIQERFKLPLKHPVVKAFRRGEESLLNIIHSLLDDAS